MSQDLINELLIKLTLGGMRAYRFSTCELPLQTNKTIALDPYVFM